MPFLVYVISTIFLIVRGGVVCKFVYMTHYKTYLDFWVCFGRENLLSYNLNLIHCIYLIFSEFHRTFKGTQGTKLGNK